MKTSTTPPIIVPRSMKGMASRTMEENMMEKVVKAWVLGWNRTINRAQTRKNVWSIHPRPDRGEGGASAACAGAMGNGFVFDVIGCPFNSKIQRIS